MVEAVAALELVLGGATDGFDVIGRGGFSDFMGADFGLGGGFDFEGDFLYGDTIIGEGGGDKIIITVA